jgi:hypothetical protein
VGDFLERYGLLSGLGVVLLGATGRLVLYVIHRRRPAVLAPAPLDAEVIPLWFRVSLNQQIPDVTVFLQVINYRTRQLRVSEATATYLHVGQGPPLENTPAGEYQIPARQSVQVMCRRTLNDAETQALRRLPWSDEATAHLAVRVRGVAGRKVIALNATGLNIRGIVAGLPSHPLIKQTLSA